MKSGDRPYFFCPFDNNGANLYYPAMFIKSPKTLSFLALLLAFLGFSYSQAKAEIVVLIPPQKFIVEAIVKDTDQVIAILPTVQSLEHFSPSPSHLRALETATLYIELGHPAISVESQLISKIVEEAKVESVSMSSKVKLKEHDPHYWVSPTNIKLMIEATLPALIKLHPEHEQLYRNNAAELEKQAQSLHDELAAKLAPIKGRSFLVFHPSWQYFAEEFGLNELAIEHHGSEPGPAFLEQLINKAKADNVHCVFNEPQLSPSAVTAVAELLGAKVGVLNPLGEQLFTNIREAADKILKATTDGSCS